MAAMTMPIRSCRPITVAVCLLLLALGFAGTAFAADLVAAPGSVAQLAPAPAADGASAINSGDNAWVLASSALVLMMTAPGLILFYGGLVRTKNVLSTMMHSLILMAVVSTLWMVFGYSMAFSDGNAFFGNPFKHLFLQGVGAAPDPDYSATVPSETFMLFQMMFAIITPASSAARSPNASDSRRILPSSCFGPRWSIFPSAT